jgi:N-methylhydantoinase A/oxoprolinase/acetone carboxylase beta subunit/N-methylhydantoinase B/oxoprolinase/acetone carboxylase alpha subunit
VRYRIGVDIGGTFTDCVVLDDAGRRTVSKAPTTPDALEQGVVDALEASARERGVALRELLGATDHFVHGTTRATNALLTRSGVRTGLITTRGHEHAIVIGRVYAKVAGLAEREIVHSSRLRKPEPIVPRELIRGVTERIDRDGEILVPLDEEDAVRAIDSLAEAGVESIAVCLLWSFLNEAHERRLEELIAERAPGVNASFSCDVAPRMGEFERAATTAVNAYVGPLAAGYLEALKARLTAEGLRRPLLVMQASGGLTSPEDAALRPIVTLDSGPTGGVLGCRHLARGLGEEHVICTDVGGTSFDVGLVLDGEAPLDAEPVVGRYPLRFPKVLVRSIGAGGGSIAWVDAEGLLRVGPQSAGARPGPACYGLGGTEPTVTDADVVLGYLDPEAFLGGRMALDRELALRALARLGERLRMEPEEVAVGIFRIANSHMADLIRTSTIERGHDPRECVLVAYGGAGPTHAAFYAHEIGSKAILVPAESTAFSALGLLTCDLTHTAESSRRIVSPYSDAALADMSERFAALEARVLRQFEREGAAAEAVTITRTLGVRYRAQVHTLEVPLDPGPLTRASMARVLERFAERYERIYGAGAVVASNDTEVELHRVVGTVAVKAGGVDASEPPGRGGEAAPKGRRRAYFEPDGFVTTPVYDGEALEPGSEIEGPALVERMGGTTVVPPGHVATVDPHLTLRLVRREEAEPAARQSRGRKAGVLDPVTFEVIRHRLWAINDNQAKLAARLSGSPIVYDAYDFNAALLTPDGRGLYTGVYIMHHGATIDALVARVLAEWGPDGIREGDMFFTNDPWWGALHANDGILVAPILWEGKLVAWSGIVMHDNDVGGPVPGSFVTGARDRFGEAPLIPPLRIAEGFELRPDLHRLYLRNSRTPDLNALNMHGRVAALRSTHARVHELIRQYGLETVTAALAGILDYVEGALRRRLLELPDGSWYAEGYHDHDGMADALYRICCRVTKRGDRLEFDLRGTSPQAPGPINCARPALHAAVLGIVLNALCYDLPWTLGGIERVVDIVSEEGTLNSAVSPAATSMASIMATLSTQDVVSAAVARMLLTSERYAPEAQATWSPGIGTGSWAGVNRDGEYSVTPIGNSFGGGAGARTTADGIDTGGVLHSMGSRIPNVETVESRSPLLQLFRREQRDGGGAGRFRGGVGLEWACIPHKIAGPAVANTLASGVALPAGHGLAGGRPGAAVSNVVLRGTNVRELFARGVLPLSEADLSAREVQVLAAKQLVELAEDDVLVGVVSGGAGYGDPLRRDPALVARDVRHGLVSSGAAASVYGVLLRGGEVDEAATEAERERLRAERLPDGGPEGAGVEGAVLHPVGDVLEAVEADGSRLIRCALCHRSLGPYGGDYKRAALVREVPLASAGPYGRCDGDRFVLREFACPGCGTAVACDVQLRTDPIREECRLGG